MKSTVYLNVVPCSFVEVQQAVFAACLAYSLILKIEEVCPFETLVNFCQTA
jgi:hypothetical protein